MVRYQTALHSDAAPRGPASGLIAGTFRARKRVGALLGASFRKQGLFHPCRRGKLSAKSLIGHAIQKTSLFEQEGPRRGSARRGAEDAQVRSDPSDRLSGVSFIAQDLIRRVSAVGLPGLPRSVPCRAGDRPTGAAEMVPGWSLGDGSGARVRTSHPRVIRERAREAGPRLLRDGPAHPTAQPTIAE